MAVQMYGDAPERVSFLHVRVYIIINEKTDGFKKGQQNGNISYGGICANCL